VVRYRVLISGRVQGVFFRDTCRRLAAVDTVAVHPEPPEGLSVFHIR